MSSRPPLTALYAFATVARCGNLRKAADELCVTPGAVSRQIQLLESYLGCRLFERGAHQMELTSKGMQLQAGVGDKLASIAAQVSLLRRGGRKTVVQVDAGVTFAMHWLLPRLASFHEAQAGLEVQLGTSGGPIAGATRVDLHIRRDPTDLGGLAYQPFLEEWSVLVGCPRLLKNAPSRVLDIVQKTPRIGARSRPTLWTQWGAHHRIPANSLEPTLEFDNTVLAIQAALEGLGVVVVPEIFVATMLQRRLLSLVDQERVLTGHYSYAVRLRRESTAVMSFVEWLRGQASYS
jgi:LysR family transcriptional regulator, glycine cleavage system transcriptional activator